MLLATIKKELLLISRDIQALTVLFLMPLAFILIMSFALQNTYNNNHSDKLNGAYLFPATNTTALFTTRFFNYLNEEKAITWHSSLQKNVAELQAQVRNNEYDFAISLNEDVDSDEIEPRYTVNIYLSPNIHPQSLLLIKAHIKEALGKTRLHTMLQQISGGSSDASTKSNIDAFANKDRIDTHYVYLNPQASNTPTSVQQSVPAWLVFAMFFVLIPMSSAMIAEVHLGTLQRLRSMHRSSTQFLLGKAIPFLMINQIQFIIMMATGKLLIPLLGGDDLSINGSVSGLLLMSFSCSIAAVGFALLIAVSAKTYEQANAVGGTLNIILAAIGGIMVPKFIMPQGMQTLSNVSPMSWALDGFLDIILQGGTIIHILPYACALIFFGGVSFAIAQFIFTQRTLYNQ